MYSRSPVPWRLKTRPWPKKLPHAACSRRAATFACAAAPGQNDMVLGFRSWWAASLLLARGIGIASPPRGFNSWDAYGQSLNESAALEIAQTMVEILLPHGYETLVIDGGWSDAYNHDECGDCVDAYGRP